MPKHELWGTDGGHIGTIAVDATGGKEMGIVQGSITVCAWKNFDFWWHDVYSRVRDMIEDGEPMPEGLDGSITLDAALRQKLISVRSVNNLCHFTGRKLAEITLAEVKALLAEPGSETA